MQLILSSLRDIEQAGQTLGRALKYNKRGVVALIGPLGAGKTTIVRVIVKGLSGKYRAVASPTFVLWRRYKIPKNVIEHLDCYRISAKEFQDLGILERVGVKSIVLVEWADRVRKFLPKDHLTIYLRYGTKPHIRYLTTATSGKVSEKILKLWRKEIKTSNSKPR